MDTERRHIWRALLQTRDGKTCLRTAAAPLVSVFADWYEMPAWTKLLWMLRRVWEEAEAGAEGVCCKRCPQKLPKRQRHELAIRKLSKPGLTFHWKCQRASLIICVQMAVRLIFKSLVLRLLFRLFPVTGSCCPDLSWAGLSLSFTTAPQIVPQSCSSWFSRC